MNRVILTVNGQAIILNHPYNPETPTTMTFKIPGIANTVFTLELMPREGPENAEAPRIKTQA